MRNALRVVVLVAIPSAGCHSGAPPAHPSPPPSAIVPGRITDAIDGTPVAAARVLNRDTGEGVVSGADGSFSLPVNDSGSTPIAVDRSGYWTRTTRVSPAGTLPVDIDIIPDGRGFSLPFFDDVLRGTCEGQASLGSTRRWVSQPTFEIWTSEFECATVREDRNECTTVRVTGSDAPVEFFEAVATVLSEDVADLTGGVLTGAPVRHRSFAPGDRVSYDSNSSEALVDGAITIAHVNDEDHASIGGLSQNGVSGAWAGCAQVHGIDFVEGLTSHEIAHALGYDHPCGGVNVPLTSVMQRASRPSDADRLHGRIMYDRPPVSSSPDHDPDVFVLNVESRDKSEFSSLSTHHFVASTRSTP